MQLFFFGSTFATELKSLFGVFLYKFNRYVDSYYQITTRSQSTISIPYLSFIIAIFQILPLCERSSHSLSHNMHTTIVDEKGRQ